MKKLPLLSALFLFLLFPSPVKAAQVLKLTAIPPRLEIEADPGEVVTRQLKVRNEGDSQVAVEVKVDDFIVTDKEGTPIRVEEEISGRWASSRWINVTPKKFLLNPGETKKLDFVAVIPDDATAGGHYAIIFYSPVEEGDLALPGEGARGASGISPNVGTLVYTTVSGDIKEAARVRRMTVPKLSEFGPIEIETEIENLSDIHIKPLGTIRIYDMLGNLKTTLKLDEANIFPTTTRVFTNTWKKKWGLGKYKAVLQAGYGNQGKVLTAAVFFWIVPWRIIVIALLTIILVLLLIIYFKKPKVVKEPPAPATRKK